MVTRYNMPLAVYSLGGSLRYMNVNNHWFFQYLSLTSQAIVFSHINISSAVSFDRWQRDVCGRKCMMSWEEVQAAPVRLLALVDTMRSKDFILSPAHLSRIICKPIDFWSETHYFRLVLPFERHIKGEEEKPLPPCKPRKPYKRNLDSKVHKTEKKRKSIQSGREMDSEVTAQWNVTQREM